MAMLLEERLYTVEEFMSLPDDGNRYELIEGEIVAMPGPSHEHGIVVDNLFKHFHIYLAQNPTGRSMNNLAFKLSPKNAPLPDFAYLSNEKSQGKIYKGAFPGAPDLAVEVASETDYIFNTDDKIKRYLQAGTKICWLINPNSRLVFVYTPQARKPTVFDETEELDGGELLPGFRLQVSKLFE
jgi:Uma2 family endonuclease